VIVSPRQSKVLLQYAPNATEAWFHDSGHFPMMDEPERFHQTILDFLNKP
jgi:pimeloyl-ACP methyl ester carboxylesterase